MSYSGSTGYSSIDSYCSSCTYQPQLNTVSIDYCVSASSGGYAASRSFDSSPAVYSGSELSGPSYKNAGKSGGCYSGGVCNNMTVTEFDPESFLSTYRIPTMFIGKAKQVKELVELCFEKTLGKRMPDNIIIRICDKKELKSVHRKFGGRWSEGIAGFAVNRNKKNQINEIFIKEDSLDKVMITIGHEIGHLLGKRLDGTKEEAKAFAFELAWLDTIREYNIGGIGKNIIQINPAKNNFHDIAFKFVIDLIRDGMKAIDVFKDLIFSL